MQFEPLEAYLPMGHRLQLVLSQDVPAADGVSGSNGAIDTLPRPEQGPYVVDPTGSALLLPTLHEFKASEYSAYKLDHGN